MSRIYKEGGNVLFSNVRVALALLGIAVLLVTPLFAESPLQQHVQPSVPAPSSTLPDSHRMSVFAYVNQLADLSRAGNTDAARELTRQTFRNGGIKSEIADSFGFTDRIVQAEAAYRNGTQAPIHEADIVKAVNNLANTVGAPAWVRTNQIEVRKWRVRLLATYPRLIASKEPPDTNGHYKALSENMRPVEAAYIALTLIYQKHYNPDFQFTDEEQVQNSTLDTSTVKAKHLERTQTFGMILRGPSSSASVRDLLNAGDYFFDDMRINRGTSESPTSIRTPMQKGAH